MINAIEKNLCRGVNLLNSISDEQYSNSSTPPYYSSIGTHIRHILDIFNCIFIGLDTQKVNFSERERNPIAEKTTSGGIAYFNDIISKLKTLSEEDFKQIIAVTDELGDGKVTVDYSLEAVLMQAHSHAVHHFATIGYIVSKLDIELLDDGFGYNPTSPRLSSTN